MHSPNRNDVFNVFEKYEISVKQRLCKSDVPYLGLIDGLLDDATASFIQKALVQSGGKLINFEKGLRISPCLFVGYLVRTIKANLGSDNAGSAVYGCINLAMGRKKDAPQNNEERKQLWKAFCHACKKLELPLSNRLYGANYMVDAYLGQVGVAEAYIGDVYNRMEKYARENGLPDVDDFGAQLEWYDSFKKSPKNRFGKRTQRALMIDNQGYYLSQFINMITGAKSEDTVHDPSKVNVQSLDSYKICVPPAFIFDGEELSIILPFEEGESLWQVEINGQLEEVDVRGHDKNIALDDFDIREIVLSLPKSQKVNIALWTSDINNQFAIFNCDSSAFVGRFDLSEDGVSLSPGQYRVLSRFAVSNNWLSLEEAYQDGFFVGEFELKAGQTCELKRGPVSFNICAHSEARMTFEGGEVVPYSGKSFYASKNLILMIELPTEWMRSQSEYELELSAGSLGERRTLPVSVGGDGKIISDLCFEQLGWSPGMARVRAVLRKKNERRELVKKSALVWLGLESLDHGFNLDVSATPTNINADYSKNVRKENEKLVPVDRDVQFVELSFDIAAKRSQRFTFALLGTFVYLSDLEEGFRKETLLPLGSTLSSNYTDTRRVRIFSTEEGCLEIGGHTVHESFSRKPWCKPSIAALLDKIESDANTLVLKTPNYTLPILKLVAPHYVDQWSIVVKSRGLDVSFRSPAGIDSFVVDATNLITLSQHKQILSTHSGECIGRKGEIAGLLVNQDSGDHSQLLTLNVDELDDGAWFIRFDSSIKGKWGSITNTRKDHYGLGVVVERGRIVSFSSSLFSDIRDLTQVKKRELFLFVNSELKKCYEHSCWNTLDWIKGIWCYLIRDKDVVNDEKVSQILSHAEFIPSDVDSSSWVPQVHMGAFNLDLYTRQSNYYRQVDVKNSVSLRCLKLMGEAKKTLSLCLKSELIADSVVVAFENRKAVMEDGAEPKALDVGILAIMLPSVFNDTIWGDICSGEFIPAFGDMLGGAHLAYSQYMFVANARRAQGGNEFNRPAHNNMIFRFAGDKKDALPLLVPDSFFESETEKELLESICYFSSVLAQSCRASAWTGEEFTSLLAQLSENLLGDNTKLEGILSYYFGVGGDLFHYYLLLWDVHFLSRVSVNNKEGVCVDV
ncbi:hypothetical protein MARGE09_P3427 [Marinagarivorans cellulosilyticus]|uniref:Uncharacterized protein n=2 Tax=Marinagarivorans cellulosilyticus TaxID=2721545 RepID=A0AAN2BLP4_9GAMM|nr:hypothetical protein MARGE09_P3427 [Marinagarivorans cellulosilyticus]